MSRINAVNEPAQTKQSQSAPKKMLAADEDNQPTFSIKNIREESGKLYAGPAGWEGVQKATEKQLQSNDWYNCFPKPDENKSQDKPAPLKLPELPKMMQDAKENADKQPEFLERLKVTCQQAASKGQLFNKAPSKYFCGFHNETVIKINDNNFINIKETTPDFPDASKPELKALTVSQITNNRFIDHFGTITNKANQQFQPIDQGKYFRLAKPQLANSVMHLNNCAEDALRYASGEP
jgi:hypothetical protein